MLRNSVSASLLVLLCCTGTPAADSGPAAETAVAAFHTFAVTGGDVQNASTDYTTLRDTRPTLYCFVPRDRWSRPAARLLRKLDTDIASVSDAQVVAVFLDDDVPGVKNYLPLCQQSLQLSRTALTVFEESASGPPEWGINTSVDLTIVAARDGKVVKSFAIDSPNETLAAEILQTLQ